MRKVLSVFRVTVIVILSILLVINIWFLAARYFFHEDLPKVFGFSRAVVISGSMEPTFSPGDMLFFCESGNLEVGDIVIFRSDGDFVTHRIVGINENGYVTMGDANNTKDGTISRSDIEGKMVLILPGMGNVADFLRTPLGFLVLLGVGVLINELPRLFDKITEKKRGKQVKISDR